MESEFIYLRTDNHSGSQIAWTSLYLTIPITHTHVHICIIRRITDLITVPSSAYRFFCASPRLTTSIPRHPFMC
jgi:hypothetical protein